MFWPVVSSEETDCCRIVIEHVTSRQLINGKVHDSYFQSYSHPREPNACRFFDYRSKPAFDWRELRDAKYCEHNPDNREINVGGIKNG